MIRTIWLGFIFLILLAGAGSFRFAFGHFDTANASGIVVTEQIRAIGWRVAPDTLTKADQLTAAYVAPTPDVAELAKAAYSAAEPLLQTPPALVTPDIVEPPAAVEQAAIVEPQAPEVVSRRAKATAAPVVRKAKSEKPKAKLPKPDAVASKSSPATDLKTCQLEGFDAFRYAFSLPTGCHSSPSGVRTGAELPMQPRADAT